MHDNLKENAIKQAEGSLKASELHTYNGGTTYNWIMLLCEIYAIKSLEQEAKVKVLKTDRELSEIWGISPKTFERWMSTLLSIDC